jgi:homocitrate synthase NifV
LDTPHVAFSADQKVELAEALAAAGVPEIEIVAPSRVCGDLAFARRIREAGIPIITSGLIYAYGSRCAEEIRAASQWLNRFDLLMPLARFRKPAEPEAKIRLLKEMLALCSDTQVGVGAGFPHSTQTEIGLLLDISTEAVRSGARRITVYDTNGSGDPVRVQAMIRRLKKAVTVPVFFHGHNDLGLATANALAAVSAGAQGLDVTVNGLGDRAGNAALEQVALNLQLKGRDTGIVLGELRKLSALVERASGVAISKLAPITGEYIFQHRSPSHGEHPGLFLAYAPELVGFPERRD